MIARLQAVLTISLLLAAGVWGFGATWLGHPAWGVAGALVILLGYALFLAAEFALMYAVQGADAAPRPTLRQITVAWAAEVVTAPRVFLWRQPFRSRAEPDHLPIGADRPGVVLVHGFFCNRGLWNPWMRRLRARGVPFIAVNLEPIFGSIDHYADPIEAAVARLEAATGRPAVLVGHSMGGVAIRAWLARFNADDRVRRVVTIGTPHHGTWIARFGHTPNGRQMRQRGPWMADLASREPAERYARFTCFFGHCDNIVFPSSAAVLTGAQNIHVPATAHVHMAFSPVVFDAALSCLGEPDERRDGEPARRADRSSVG